MLVASGDQGTPEDNLRGYDGHIFGTVEKLAESHKNYVSITLVCRAGYYHGVNIDYIVNYMNEDGESVTDLDDFETWVPEKQEYKTLSNTERKRLESQARSMSKKLHKVISQYTEGLRKVGTFSNGEAVYEKAGN
jgi:hypothetical protein